MAKSMQSGPATGYYGADGSIAPAFSFGRQKLAPSLLSGNGSHMTLWTSVVIHVCALVLTISAVAVFFAADRSEGKDLQWGWGVCALIGQVLGVLGTLVATALIRNVLDAPLINTLGGGLFLGGFVALAKLSFAHSNLPADTAENVLMNLALFFQAFGIASIVANGFCASSKAGGL